MKQIGSSLQAARPLQVAACNCLTRMVHRGAVPVGVRLGDLLARHARPDERDPDTVWHLDWESVLGEVILASVADSAAA